MRAKGLRTAVMKANEVDHYLKWVFFFLSVFALRPPKSVYLQGLSRVYSLVR